MNKGWYWPVALAGMLAAGVIGNLYFMLRAVGDPSFAVEPDYYAKAVAWDAHQQQARVNADLGWSAAIEVAPADLASGRARLVVVVSDPDGRRLSGLSVALEAFHNARAAHVVKARLSETPQHDYAAEVPVVRPGLWEFRIVAERGSLRFTALRQQDVPGDLR